MKKNVIIALIILGVVVLLAAFLFIVFKFHDQLQWIADLILIMCALFAWIAFGFIAYTAWTVVQLIRQVQGEVNLLSTEAQSTLTETKATGKFITGTIVKPASLAFGYATAVRATIKSLSQDVSKKAKP